MSGEEAEARRQVIVEAETKPEAMKKGAEELGLTLSEIEATVIQVGTSGLLGFFARPWRLRIRPRVSDDSLLEATLEEALEAAEGVDGSFNLQVSEGKILLTIHPPLGTGKAVEADEIIDHLQHIGLEYCDFDEVRKAALNPDGEPVKIGVVPPDENFNARYEVQVLEEGLSARMTILPPRLGGEPASLKGARRKLKSERITEGIKWDRIENMIENENYNEPVEVARGRPPEKGDPAEVITYFETDKKPRPAESEGRVDFRELNLINNVEEGEILAEIRPATPGRPGITVRGKKIKAERGDEKNIVAGKNVRRQNNKFYATASGNVTISEGELRVQEIYIVEGDVDYSTGNIDFDGTVVVKGNVHDRFKIKASGDIIIEQGVGKSYIQSEQDIVVKEGIRGKGGAQLNARGNVISSFIEQAGVIAQGYVIGGEMILHSRIDAGKGIYVAGGRGLITGGSVRAGLFIYACEVGSIGTTETRMEVGIDPGYFRRAARIEGKLVDQREKLDKIERAVNTLEGRGPLPEKDREKLEKLLANRERLQQNIENFEEEKDSLFKQATLREDALISVENAVHSGTRIGIGSDYRFIRTGGVQHCTFRLRDGRVEIHSFYEISPPEIT